VPALAATNIGLIGALHEGGEKKIEAPRRGGGASIESDPVTSFSTDVEDSAVAIKLLRAACFPLCIQPPVSASPQVWRILGTRNKCLQK
jgi:hypothetical protein